VQLYVLRYVVYTTYHMSRLGNPRPLNHPAESISFRWPGE